MSLAEYVPLREATLRHGSKDMPVVGIKSFSIDIDRLTSSYNIWVNVNDAVSIVSASDNAVTSAISLVPTEMEEPAIFIIDKLSIPCIIKGYSYHSIKHAYLVKIEFPLDRNKVKTYIYEKEDENREQTRFDLLDL